MYACVRLQSVLVPAFHSIPHVTIQNVDRPQKVFAFFIFVYRKGKPNRGEFQYWPRKICVQRSVLMAKLRLRRIVRWFPLNENANPRITHFVSQAVKDSTHTVKPTAVSGQSALDIRAIQDGNAQGEATKASLTAI